MSINECQNKILLFINVNIDKKNILKYFFSKFNHFPMSDVLAE